MSTRILNHHVIDHPDFLSFLFAIIACAFVKAAGIVPMTVILVSISAFLVLRRIVCVVRDKFFLWIVFPVF